MENWSTYLTPDPIERQLGLFCLGVGEQRIPPAATPERALGCHAAVFLRQGRGQLLHGPDRVVHEIEAPALFWLFPGILHGYRPATSWQQSWALFGGTATAALTHLGYLTPEEPVRRYADARARCNGLSPSSSEWPRPVRSKPQQLSTTSSRQQHRPNQAMS